MTKIVDFWNFPSPPRSNQIKAFDWLEQQTAKFLFLECPVGSGKSLIGMTYSRYLSDNAQGSSFILTPQKILQEQYQNSFSTDILASLYGKNNYTCRTHNTTCDIGSLFKGNCSSCSYNVAKLQAKQAPNVVLNYTLALLMFSYTHIFSSRKLMVLDECHNLEEILTEFNAFQINETRTKRFGVTWRVPTTLEEAINWITKSYIKKAQDYFDNLANEVEEIKDHNIRDTAAIRILREYLLLDDHLETLYNFLSQPISEIKEKFVLVTNPFSFKFKHLKGSENFLSMLNPMANRFLFMSSTILDYKAFCNDIGVNPNEAAFLSLGSEFPAENRPIFYIPKMRMNNSWADSDRHKERENLLSGIEDIIKIHKDDSGIIHTASYQVADWICSNLKTTSHSIMHHNPSSGDKREQVINAFIKNKKPAILVSPSITEGLDFKDELSRFAIIAKVPFPYLGDQWIKKRMEMSQKWYMRKTLIDIIQGSGRVVRSSTDWGHVYILDMSFEYLLSQAQQLVPQWWYEAYRKIS